MMEFLLGGLAACGSCLISNPAEVVKTRMQLQGELQKKGLYTKHYKNAFHAFYTIAKNDGFMALQKGLLPATIYQFIMNGTRLGIYQHMQMEGFTKSSDGNVSFWRSAFTGAFAGCVGGFIASPLYLVKTHLQVQSASEVAVGYQHHHMSATSALIKIYREAGVSGLYRGAFAASPRLTIGSATQLSCFAKVKSFIYDLQWDCCPENSLPATFLASVASGLVVAATMTPFDVISTRLYNQGVTINGEGMLYSSFIDCTQKTFSQEGFWGFYKGFTASFLRLAPHTVFSLVLWDELRKLYTVFLGNSDPVFSADFDWEI